MFAPLHIRSTVVYMSRNHTLFITSVSVCEVCNTKSSQVVPTEPDLYILYYVHLYWYTPCHFQCFIGGGAVKDTTGQTVQETSGPV